MKHIFAASFRRFPRKPNMARTVVFFVGVTGKVVVHVRQTSSRGELYRAARSIGEGSMVGVFGAKGVHRLNLFPMGRAITGMLLLFSLFRLVSWSCNRKCVRPLEQAHLLFAKPGHDKCFAFGPRVFFFWASHQSTPPPSLLQVLSPPHCAPRNAARRHWQTATRYVAQVTDYIPSHPLRASVPNLTPSVSQHCAGVRLAEAMRDMWT